MFLLIEISSNFQRLDKQFHVSYCFFSYITDDVYWFSDTVPVPSLRPNLFSTTESDDRIKMGLPEPSGNKRKKCFQGNYYKLMFLINVQKSS